ncbi:MAG: alkaline phosphatase family protein [Thaumarchaeota archaeon]|nr:alkaline phosphatase family protein [Nitrososphaerota archaeon]
MNRKASITSEPRDRKVGYVLLDGCSDRPAPALNYTTPLEAAYTPNLDAIARMGTMGRVITVRRGISPESDIAVFNMLGYSFAKGYPGRGVVESIGAGIPVRDGDLALRANFATASDGKIVDRRAGRDITDDQASMLEEELKKVKLTDADFEVRSTIGHRAVVVIRSDSPLSGEISNTDPGYIRTNGFGAAKATEAVEAIQTSTPLEKTAASKRAAELVNEFASKSMKVLDEARVNQDRKRNGKKAANMLIFRDAGSFVPALPSFEEKHGYKGVALVEMPAEVGIAILLKMKMVKVKDQADAAVKARLFNRELRDGTVVYAHIKGPDEFGHDGDAPGKKKNIEKIDEEFFGPVGEKFEGLKEDARLAVSCDHSTPCILKMHSADPVPLLITGLSSAGERDSCRFTEKDAKAGSMGTLIGKTVMQRVLSSN